MSEEFLDLPRCPWCHTATPTLKRIWDYEYRLGIFGRNHWRNFQCSKCHHIVMTRSESQPIGSPAMRDVFPSRTRQLDESIPKRARVFLYQAQDTIDSPDASIMVCSSALDVMLQGKGIEKSKDDLYTRIKKAAQKNLITEDMAKWAHQIRLVANESRHPDKDVSAATLVEARQSLEFTLALAEILYALPARVTKGLEESAEKAQSEEKEEGG